MIVVDAESIVRENECNLKIERILSVSEHTGWGGCDSHFFALAEDLGVTLHTFDKKVLSITPSVALKPKPAL